MADFVRKGGYDVAGRAPDVPAGVRLPPAVAARLKERQANADAKASPGGTKREEHRSQRPRD